MVHWSSKVLILLNAKTSNLRELAIMAGADPSNFYLGSAIGNLDVANQDLVGMAFRDSPAPTEDNWEVGINLYDYRLDGREPDDLGIGPNLLHGEIAQIKENIKAVNRKERPKVWAAEHHRLGNSYLRLAEYTRLPGQVARAIQAYRLALLERRYGADPQEWGISKFKLGNALLRFGELKLDIKTVEEAAITYRELLILQERGLPPIDWAMNNYRLGNALLRFGMMSKGVEALKQALSVYEEALRHQSARYGSQVWALTRHKMADALLVLGRRTWEVKTIESSEVAYTEALNLRVAGGYTYDQARSMRGLADATTALVEMERSDARVNLAINLYRHCIQLFKLIKEDWEVGATQYRLAILLHFCLNNIACGVTRDDVLAACDAAAATSGFRGEIAIAIGRIRETLGNVEKGRVPG